MNNAINKISAEEIQKIESLLNEIKKDKNSDLFLEPVDWKGQFFLT
jgi:hypothetical protein